MYMHNLKKYLRLATVEFYITNVCNLTCEGCNRFNNYKFSGHQKWDNFKDVYKEWADQLDVYQITILGGEPLYNPDYMKWVSGIRDLWPAAKLTTVTNGYRLDQINGLYDFLLAHNKNTYLSIGIHNKKHRSMLMTKIKNFLVGPLTYKFDNSNIYQQKIIITDSNNVEVKVEYNWWFHQGALIKIEDGKKFTLHNSDVKKAHDICHSKYCHHFMHGKLYKCGAVALFPEFSKQHDMVLTSDDEKLMTGYRALEINDSVEFKKEFIRSLPNSIPQCKFCPEEYHGEQIYSEEKKIVFIKKRDT
jgi:organic radical activating enzyme